MTWEECSNEDKQSSTGTGRGEVGGRGWVGGSGMVRV
jgi:hypothetical protein